MKFTFLFLNLAKIHIFIPKSAHGGSAGLGFIPKKQFFYCFPYWKNFVKEQSIRKNIIIENTVSKSNTNIRKNIMIENTVTKTKFF